MGREDRHSKSYKKSKKHKKSSDSHRSSHGLPKGVNPIFDDDFFLKATEFRVWLHKKRNQYVEDLSTQEATRLFQKKFVTKWNDGKLPRMYYDGIPERILEETKRTKHQWGFLKRLDDKERFDLATAKDSVEIATKKTNLLREDAVERKKRVHRTEGNNREEENDKAQERNERKRLRKHHESVLEELVPKETGREAMLEKRRQRADRLHGAARDREATIDGLDVDDSFLMGSNKDDDELRQRLARRQQARDRKQEERNERMATLAAKESERMDKFLKDMGIDSNTKQRITIPPRS